MGASQWEDSPLCLPWAVLASPMGGLHRPGSSRWHPALAPSNLSGPASHWLRADLGLTQWTRRWDPVITTCSSPGAGEVPARPRVPAPTHPGRGHGQGAAALTPANPGAQDSGRSPTWAPGRGAALRFWLQTGDHRTEQASSTRVGGLPPPGPWEPGDPGPAGSLGALWLHSCSGVQAGGRGTRRTGVGPRPVRQVLTGARACLS